MRKDSGRRDAVSVAERATAGDGGFTHVVFDFDGTLADSLLHLIAAFGRIAPRFRLNPTFDLATARTLPTRELFRRMGVRFWQLPRLIRAFQAEAARDADALELFPDVPAMLRELSASYTLGVLSSSREDVIRGCLRRHGVEGLFAFVVGYPRLFGKAKAIRRILKAEAIDRDGLLYVGDELRDLEAAGRAKVSAAAVTWGFNAEEQLRAAGPRFVARTPAELLTAVAGRASPSPRS